MVIPGGPNSLVACDLDDTLFKEVEYVRSGFYSVAEFVNREQAKEHFNSLWELYKAENRNVFQRFCELHPALKVSSNDLLDIYRSHLPSITLPESSRAFLERCRTAQVKLGLVTDGSSVRQRNKLQALGIEKYFDFVIISEESGSSKPEPNNFRYLEDSSLCEERVYIADNPDKDFIAPNRLGWRTICLRDNGQNIHPQQLKQPEEFLPGTVIDSLDEIEFELKPMAPRT